MMVLSSVFRLQRLSVVVAVFAGKGPWFMSASALDLTVSSCADLAALPATVTEDINLFLDDTRFNCDEVTTVAVNGYFKQFRVTSDNGNVEFTNVRFVVSNRARFSLSLGNTESPGTTMATFSGVDAVKSDGGAFYVENGCVAEFSAPITFDSNSVFGGFSGGAFYAAGVVDFKYDTVFNGNTVMNDGTEVGAESGGGLCVAEDGEVSFETYASFEGNVAQALGKGGAVANYGSLVFQGTSVYSGNIAEENHDNFFGYGGAIFTEKGSITVFKARTVMQNNEGASGGALYNVGTTILEAGAFFGDNKATGEERAKGGHIYTKGYVSTTGDLTFLQGSALRGGAVYVTSKGTFFPNDEARFIGNTASAACPDVYDAGADPRCEGFNASIE